MAEMELKPCPFCGGEVVKIKAPLGTEMLVCHKCGMDVCFFFFWSRTRTKSNSSI